MGRTLTNATTLAYAIEESLGVLPASPTWFSLEPNGIGKYGAEITTVARSPISKLRQRRKGTTVDLDSAAEYDGDLTLSSFVDFLEGFLFAIAVNADLVFRAAPATALAYTIPAATAAQAAKLQFVTTGPKSLVYAKGYEIAGNNGLKPLTADTALAGTSITVSGLAVEATPPTNAEVVIAGVRPAAGDLAIVVAAGIATLTSGNNGVAGGDQLNFTTLGLTRGQFIHIGGLLAANQFSAGAGYGRIRTIAAGTLVLDKLTATLATDTGATETVDLLFGRFVRNVPVDSAEYIERSYQFEAGYENLYETDPPTPLPEPDGFEYAIGNLANVMNWEMPLTDKSAVSFEFIGTNSDDIVDNADRKTNAATPVEPLHTGAFNTSADFVRLRIADVDETGLTSDFKDMTSKWDNQVSPEKVLGLLGARYMNNGNFLVDIETTALFTSPLVVARIKSNATVSMEWALKNDDGSIWIDIPSATMGNGAKEFPINESIRIALEVQAFVDAFFGTSIGVSLFPITP